MPKAMAEEGELRALGVVRELLDVQAPPVQRGGTAVEIGGTRYRPLYVREDIAAKFVAALSVADATSEDVVRIFDTLQAQADAIATLAEQVLVLQARAQAKEQATLAAETIREINHRVLDAASQGISVGEASVDIELRSRLVKTDAAGNVVEVDQNELQGFNAEGQASLGSLLDKLSGAKLTAKGADEKTRAIRRRLGSVKTMAIREEAVGTAKLQLRGVVGAAPGAPKPG